MKKARIYTDLDMICGIPAFDTFSTVDLLTQGQNQQLKDRVPTPGTVRGGSVGAIINGSIHGICHRKAYLRYNGIETPLDLEIELMTTQGEKNEEIWLNELRNGLPKEYYVLDQTEFDCSWTLSNGISGSGSPDLVIFDRRTKKPIRGLELKNISSMSKVKSAHYELRPAEDHLIQAANYSLRMGDQYNAGIPVPWQLCYSSRSIWQFYSMADKVKKLILDAGYDISYSFGKPMSVKPFHRIYNITWSPEGWMKYWTAGYKNWIITEVTRESIDEYYTIVSELIDSESTLGPRPTTQHIDGKSSYSPCGYCDFSSVCDINNSMTPSEFKDHATALTHEAWAKRLGKQVDK